MEYIFLVMAAAWGLQFLLSYWQLRNFHRRLADLRKLGQCAVGLDGNRWRGRTYGVLVLDSAQRVRQAASFSGLTIFSSMKPIDGLEGMSLPTLLSTNSPPEGISGPQWRALRHAAQFFKATPNTT